MRRANSRSCRASPPEADAPLAQALPGRGVGRPKGLQLLLSVLACALVLAVVGGLVALALAAPWASTPGSASPAGSPMACSVKFKPKPATCDTGEVEVFRMSSRSNAHAGTPGGSSYDYVVCCGGVADLRTNCSGVYDTVLTLSGTDNAHVASDGSYGTKACLSVNPGGSVDCTYGTSCGVDYACLATISGAMPVTTNAHVADCGLDGYANKVCCSATAGCPDADGDILNGVGCDADEQYLGTDLNDRCPDNTSDPAWPLDQDNNGTILIPDVTKYTGKLFTPVTCPSADPNCRLDLNNDAWILIGDVTKYTGVLFTACVQ